MRKAASLAIALAVVGIVTSSRSARADEPAPPAAAGSAPQASSPGADAKWPRVHVESSKPGAALFRRDDTRKLIDKRGSVDEIWEFVCYAPCDKRVEPDAVYRVLGATIPPSDPFIVGTDDVTIRVDAGSTRLQALARGTGGLGLASVVASGVFFIAQGATDSENKEESLRVLGQVFLIGGLTLTLTSIILDSIGSTSIRSESAAGPEKVDPQQQRRQTSGVKITPFGIVF